MAWAVVTGGSRGLGAAAAVALARAGFDVVITFREAQTQAEAVVAQVEGEGRAARAHAADLSDLAAAEEIAASLAREYRPKVLVNNAGETFSAALADVEIAGAERALRVNTLAPLVLARGLAGALASHDSPGAIVNVSSVSGAAGSSSGVVYALSKGALLALTRSLAIELAPQIRVNAVIPSIFTTDMNRAPLEDPILRASALDAIPLGRIGDPRECAAAIAFLAGDASSFITGAALPVDGGVLAHLALPDRRRAATP
jgi:NAD(P)-dependent dehydrogenase (short-subunit alcohol dehydrogenase family)